MNLAPITDAAVMAAAGAITGLAGLLLAKAPLIITWLRVYIDGSDATRLRYAIGNAAMRAMREIDGGATQDAAVGRMVGHCRDSMPSALARLGTSDETLRTMCEGELARVMAGRG